MEPIRNWENVQAAGESRSLPAGGYPLKIRGAREEVSERGNKMLVVAFDISGGEYANFFQKKFDENTSANKKWSNGGIFRVVLPTNADPKDVYEKRASRLKSFTNAVEASNEGYKWNWNENTLKGKAVGGLFGREEFETSDGRTAWATKMRFPCSMETIINGSYNIPPDRPLEKEEDNQQFTPIPTEEIQEEDLPF